MTFFCVTGRFGSSRPFPFVVVLPLPRRKGIAGIVDGRRCDLPNNSRFTPPHLAGCPKGKQKFPINSLNYQIFISLPWSGLKWLLRILGQSGNSASEMIEKMLLA
jgi:hypothetical protein